MPQIRTSAIRIHMSSDPMLVMNPPAMKKRALILIMMDTTATARPNMAMYTIGVVASRTGSSG
jgi:hypothetical protein